MLRGKVVTLLLAHGGASSWHEWDDAIILMIGKQYGYFSVIVTVIVAMVIIALRRLLEGRSICRGRRLRSWRGTQEDPNDEERLLINKQG
ncbi:hypothetical protein M433DRAFT_154410 [Acidomyces richmondensis BFW]|nr:MAG: hypothetical protein FE78DRAFT_540541 [Acidomyces sp. 'richmondensis']KYG45538.1 hypothetical protein M433DRAFT_154410 [Acidomyces richmondensis BFW]